jgi:hypothetical protein
VVSCWLSFLALGARDRLTALSLQILIHSAVVGTHNCELACSLPHRRAAQSIADPSSHSPAVLVHQLDMHVYTRNDLPALQHT